MLHCTEVVSVYFKGDQLWVEVVKDLQEGEELLAEFQEHNRLQGVTSPKEESARTTPPVSRIPAKGDVSSGAAASSGSARYF